MSREDHKWLTKKEDISNASIDSLKRSLTTCDGMGENFKTLVLDELFLRLSKDNKII